MVIISRSSCWRSHFLHKITNDSVVKTESSAELSFSIFFYSEYLKRLDPGSVVLFGIMGIRQTHPAK